MVLNQPADIFPVDDIDHRRMVECCNAGFCVTYDDGNIQSLQMIPLFNLCRPCITGHTQRRNDQDLADLKGLQHKMVDLKSLSILPEAHPLRWTDEVLLCLILTVQFDQDFLQISRIG